MAGVQGQGAGTQRWLTVSKRQAGVSDPGWPGLWEGKGGRNWLLKERREIRCRMEEAHRAGRVSVAFCFNEKGLRL